MELVYKRSFYSQLYKQVDYIARDKPLAAVHFFEEILDCIDEVVNDPFMYRQSVFFKNQQIRDVIFKGYTVSFKVMEENNRIEVFSLIGWQE